MELSEAIQFFLTSYFQKKNLSARTYQRYQNELDKFYHFSQLSESAILIENIDEILIANYLNERSKILSFSKLNVVVSHLRRFFYFLQREGIIENDPTLFLRAASVHGVIQSKEITDWENMLAGLTDSLKKLGKEQYKFQAVIESRGEKEWELFNELRRRLNRSERLLEDVLESKSDLTSNFIKELLPVMDGIEAAIKSFNSEPDKFRQDGLLKRLLGRGSALPDLSQYSEGLGIIRERLSQILKRANVTVIKSLGEKFNPYEHIAIATEKRDDVEENTIIKEHLKGYRQGDEVIRLAEVVVAKRSD